MNWTDEEIKTVNGLLFPEGKERQRPVDLPSSPHGTTPGGAADYRGFPLKRASSVVISNADFGKSRSPANQYGVDQSILMTWVKCNKVVFDMARVFRRIDGHFDSCSFRRIGTDNCSFSGTFMDCDFSGTSFRGAHLVANFVRCKFHDCNMKVASWGSSFEACEFSGAKIDPLFDDVRDAAFAAESVTFVVLTHKVHVGETRHIS
ncbi:MAG: pentapeptide repeat-containing protein [Planctomyces sp.]|nr:pentapeptide repeat-containing protein [Planctomyces sp.]